MACAKCGCADGIPNVRVLDRARYEESDLSLKMDLKKRKRTLFTESVETSLRALVCRKCGYTELYASDPEQLWTAHQHNQRPI